MSSRFFVDTSCSCKQLITQQGWNYFQGIPLSESAITQQTSTSINGHLKTLCLC